MISLIKPLGGRTVTAEHIETACAAYEAGCVALEESITALELDLAAVKARHLREIKRLAGVVAGSEAKLGGLIEDAPHLFVKPRTLTLHGVKVGFTRSPGKVTWTDAEQVMRLIRQKFPAKVEELIRTNPEPNKDALRNLPLADLARIGCRIDGAGDVVVLTRTAGDVEKLVGNLIKKLVAAISEKEAVVR